MDIDEPNDSGRPYSPSQAMLLSPSPEPMDIVEENSKEDEEMKEQNEAEQEEEDKGNTPPIANPNSNVLQMIFLHILFSSFQIFT